MTLRLITDATTEPLTLEQARRHLRVDDDYTAEDADITDMIVAARRQAEHETGRVLTLQTWEKVLDAFPPAEIELGMSSVVSITSVKYFDTLAVEQTMDPGLYVLDSDTDPGYLLPATGTAWPTAYSDSTNTVRVRFSTGYLADYDKERAQLRRWMLMQIGTMFEHRKGLTASTMSELPNRWTDRLLDCYRVLGL